MRTSNLITVGLVAVMAVATVGLINQHNQLVAQAEQLTANSYQLEAQKRQLQAQTERFQARTEQFSAANVPAEREVQLVSQTELPAVVVAAPRFSDQAR
jgi:hypothetical protein